EAKRGETYIPRVPSALVVDIAESLIGERPIKTDVTGIRPGEKVHEILVSEEECHRTVDRGQYYAILPMLLELRDGQPVPEVLEGEYSSADDVMDRAALDRLLVDHRLTLDDTAGDEAELLR
ncbi:MAG: polysaccharide biosynthesis protein, partial [Thermoleophilia bacterium]